MTRETKSKIITKKHLARLERERRQTRYILIGSIIVVALVVLLIGYGILDEVVLKANRPVAKVNGETITSSEFLARLSYTSLNYGSNNPAYYSFLGDGVVDDLINDRIIRQEARQLGISVTRDEVYSRIKELLGYYPNGTPVPSPTPEKRPISTLSDQQYALVSPTPTQTASPTATVGPTPTPEILFTPTVTPTQAVTPSVVLTDTSTPTPAPTATPITAEGAETLQKNLVTYLEQNGLSESDLYRIIEGDLIREKLMLQLLPNLPTEQEQVWARQIVVTSEVTATLVIAELQAGGDFSALATQYSTDAATQYRNGDMGWFARGVQSDAFDAVAFSLEIGKYNQTPIVTEDGKYIIVQILGHENRPLQNDFERFSAWLDVKRLEATIEKFDWQAVLPPVTTPAP